MQDALTAGDTDGDTDASAARRATALTFATQGLLFISLTTRLPRFADRWDLGEVELSLLLLMIVLLAGVGSVLAEVVARHRSSASTLRTGLLVVALAVPVVAAAPVGAVFVAGLAVYGVGLGVVDATSNMQAVAVEHRYARPILPSFHGAWTFGGLVGAGLALAGAHLPLWTLAVLAAVPLAALAAPYLPRAVVAPSAAEVVPVPWRPIVRVGLALVVFYAVDTAAQTWGPTYLERAVDAPTELVALATLPYLTASLVLRLAGDGLVGRYGATPVLRTGAVLASLALVVVVAAPTWPVAVAGFALLGAGVSVVAPLSFSAAARIAGGDPARVDAVIARFNQFNYVGGLLGAVLTGLVGAGSLRVGFAVPMVLVLAIVPLARTFGEGVRAPGRP
ncbi:MFS transporter [Nocardioides flavescens]|uniref:MFS transporter n=1 Tax=Nocardioides flavescens TaxID=2691959 RepID=A0A6L7EVB0_9ACTN|nr:MFS transporter [Nocardioides flavescens]MXG89636.1 MFS transporter [Nocardioides flavescens]